MSPTLERLAMRVKSACPACQSLRHERVGEDAPPIDVRLPGWQYQHSGYHIRECLVCGLYFKSVSMDDAALNSYYAALNFAVFDHDGNFPTDEAARRVIDRLPDGARVLDFGCSTGRIWRGRANRLECYGVELNEQATEIASQRGIHIVRESSLFPEMNGQFDLVLLADVYEHLPAPVEVLERMTWLLKPSGYLVLISGNADAIKSRDRIGEYWYFRLVGHLQMMSEHHVQWIASRVDVVVDCLYRCSHYETPLLQRLRQRVQWFAYNQFKRFPDGAVSALLRFIPPFNRAEGWPNEPSLTCATDHFVAVYRKLESINS